MITGGVGFIGSYLARLLMDKGQNVILLDIAPPGPDLSAYRERFVFEQGNLSHFPFLMDCIERHGVDCIFHLGGMLSLPCENNHWGAFDANIAGTWNILEAARIKKIKKVIYGSTIATYSKDIPGDTIDDKTIQRPTSLYGITKTFGELLGRWHHRRFGLDFRGVRLPSIVGPGAKTAHLSIYNAWAIEFPLKGLPYVLTCDPDTRCPCLYYKDAALSLEALGSADASAIQTRVYNIAGITPAYSARELVKVIEERIPGAMLSFQPDNTVVEFLLELGSLKIIDECAQKEWGWKISFPLEAMVEDFIEEFNQNKKHFQ